MIMMRSYQAHKQLAVKENVTNLFNEDFRIARDAFREENICFYNILS